MLCVHSQAGPTQLARLLSGAAPKALLQGGEPQQVRHALQLTTAAGRAVVGAGCLSQHVQH